MSVDAGSEGTITIDMNWPGWKTLRGGQPRGPQRSRFGDRVRRVGDVLLELVQACEDIGQAIDACAARLDRLRKRPATAPAPTDHWSECKDGS